MNPVTKLTRFSTYITLPAFTISNTWNGYSDIVASFNCESPNNFSLTGIAMDVPSSVNYVLCISYQTNGKVTRYLLWSAQGAVMNQTIPLYVGQPILKNFRFEIWNTSQGATSQVTPINFYTSVLGKQDYRYASDGVLVGVDKENTSFEVNVESMTIAPPATGLLLQFDSEVGVNGVNWAAAINNTGDSDYAKFTANTDITTVVDPTLLHRTVITNTGAFNQGIGHNTANFGDVVAGVIVFKNNTFTNLNNILSLTVTTPGSDVSLAQYTDDAGFGEATGQFQCANFGSALGANIPGSDVNAGDWFFAIIQSIGSTQNVTAAVYRVMDGIPVYIGLSGGGTGTFSYPINSFWIAGTFNKADIAIAEFLAYNGAPSYAAILAYLAQKYCGLFSLPLTFPLTSISKTN